jgi:hypothetical protein
MKTLLSQAAIIQIKEGERTSDLNSTNTHE